MNAEDKKVPLAVEAALPQIEAFVTAAYERMREGGRLFYIGAGTSGRLALTATLIGDAKGTVRFVGTPVFDRRTGMLVVPDLDYDLDVDSRLLRSYAWMKSDALRSIFREQCHPTGDEHE